MTAAETPRAGVEPQELAAILDGLVGDQDTAEHDLVWYVHLTSRQALLAAAVDEIAGMRSRAVAGMHAAGESYAGIAAVTGLTRARVQQLVERGRIRVPPEGPADGD
jgi:hypothetical protein